MQREMRRVSRLIALVVAAALAVACQAVNPAPSRSSVPWGSSVPTLAPDAIASRPVVALGSDTITLLPISLTGAAIGVDYYYEMPHCGVLSPVDVDGSFWDAVDTGSAPTMISGVPGSFRLDSPDAPTFTASDGEGRAPR